MRYFDTELSASANKIRDMTGIIDNKTAEVDRLENQCGILVEENKCLTLKISEKETYSEVQMKRMEDELSLMQSKFFELEQQLEQEVEAKIVIENEKSAYQERLEETKSINDALQNNAKEKIEEAEIILMECSDLKHKLA
eukprot:Seg9701.1 transcript_id=Seg9701.1/GoldUCD/mRNA.D3Y31 product="hypothetical protein" protein_id=Seg9701.1/GoldUCD/D3Y31